MLLALLAFDCPAQTPVQFWFTNVAIPNWSPAVTIIPSADTALQTNGFYVVASTPVTRQPTNGSFIVPLWTGNYTVKIEGMPVSFTIAVPNTNIVVNASTLTTNLLTYLWTNAPNGLISAHWVPGWGLVVSTNLPGTAFEWLSVGIDPSVVAAGSQTPWNQPINGNQQPLTDLNWLSFSNGTAVAASDNTFGQGFRFYPSAYWLGRGVGSFGWQDNGTGSLNSANGDTWLRTDTNDSFMVFDHTGVNLLWSLDTTNSAAHKPRVLMPSGATVVANPIGSAAALTNQFQLGDPAHVWVILDGDCITASPYNYSSFVSNWPAWSSVALWKNFAHPGDGLQYLTNKWNSTVAPFIATAPAGTRILYSVLIGANDYDGFIGGQYGGPTNWVNLYNAFLQQVRAAGCQVVAHTFTARLSYNGLSPWAITNRAIMNAGIVASTNWDWLVPLANILPNCLDTNTANPLATFNTDATHPTAAGHFKWAQAWDAALRQPARHQEDVTTTQTGYGFDWIDPSGALALHASAAQTAIPGSLAVGGPITVALYQTPWVPDDTYPILSWYQVSASLYSTNAGEVTLANLCAAGPAATNSQSSYNWSGSSWPTRIPAAANGYDTLAMTNGAYLEAATTVPGLYEVVMVVRLDDWTRQGVMQLWATLPTGGNVLEAWENENTMTFGIGGQSFFGGPLINTNGFYVWDFVGNGASSQILTNGIQGASGTATVYPTVYSGLVIGNGSTPFQETGVTWEWPEMLTFTNILTAVQRASLVNSLIQKYNVYATNSVVTIGTVNGQSAVVSSQFLGTATNANYAAAAGSAVSANTAISAEFATTASSVSAGNGQLTVAIEGTGQSVISSTSNPLYLESPNGTVAVVVNPADGSFWVANANYPWQRYFQVDAFDTNVWTSGTVTANGIYITNIAPAHIAQDGATVGQNLVWNGSVWIPGTAANALSANSANTAISAELATTASSMSAGNGQLTVGVSGSGQSVISSTSNPLYLESPNGTVAVVISDSNGSFWVANANYPWQRYFRVDGFNTNVWTDGTFAGNAIYLTNLPPAGIAQDGATVGQALIWNGTVWLPGDVSGTPGGGSVEILTNGVELAAAPTILNVTASGGAAITGTIAGGQANVNVAADAAGAGAAAALNATNTAATTWPTDKPSQNATNGAAAWPTTTATQNATNGLSSGLLSAKIGAGVYDASGAGLNAAQNATNTAASWPTTTASQNSTNPLTAVARATVDGSTITLSGGVLSAPGGGGGGSVEILTNGVELAAAPSLLNVTASGGAAITGTIDGGQANVNVAADAAGAATAAALNATNTAATTWPTDKASQNATNGAAAWPTTTASQNATNGLTPALLSAKIGSGVYDASGAGLNAAQNATNTAASWPSDTASRNATNGAAAWPTTTATQNATNPLSALAYSRFGGTNYFLVAGTSVTVGTNVTGSNVTWTVNSTGGGGGGGGTVTSVSLTAPGTGLTPGGSPITSLGTLTLTSPSAVLTNASTLLLTNAGTGGSNMFAAPISAPGSSYLDSLNTTNINSQTNYLTNIVAGTITGTFSNANFAGYQTNLWGTGGIGDTNISTGSYSKIRGGWFILTNAVTGSLDYGTNASILLSNGITGLPLVLSNGGAWLQTLNLAPLASTAALAVNSLGQVVAAAGFDPAGAAELATNTAATIWPTDLASQNATNGAASWASTTASQNATNGVAVHVIATNAVSAGTNGAAAWPSTTASQNATNGAAAWPSDTASQNATNGAASWPTDTASQNATNGAASWPSDTASHNATNALNAAAWTGVATGGNADNLAVNSAASGAVYLGGFDAKSGYQSFYVPSSGIFTMDLLNGIMYGGTFNGSFVGNVSGTAGNVAIANVTTPGQILSNYVTSAVSLTNTANVFIGLATNASGQSYASLGAATNAATGSIASSNTAANLVLDLGTTPVNRATGDGSGNSISGTYATQTALGYATNGSGNIPVTVLTSGGTLPAENGSALTALSGTALSGNVAAPYGSQFSGLQTGITNSGGVTLASQISNATNGQTAAQLVAQISTTPLARATGDGSGNSISGTYATQSALQSATNGSGNIPVTVLTSGGTLPAENGSALTALAIANIPVGGAIVTNGISISITHSNNLTTTGSLTSKSLVSSPINAISPNAAFTWDTSYGLTTFSTNGIVGISGLANLTSGGYFALNITDSAAASKAVVFSSTAAGAAVWWYGTNVTSPATVYMT